MSVAAPDLNHSLTHPLQWNSISLWSWFITSVNYHSIYLYLFNHSLTLYSGTRFHFEVNLLLTISLSMYLYLCMFFFFFSLFLRREYHLRDFRPTARLPFSTYNSRPLTLLNFNGFVLFSLCPSRGFVVFVSTFPSRHVRVPSAHPCLSSPSLPIYTVIFPSLLSHWCVFHRPHTTMGFRGDHHLPRQVNDWPLAWWALITSSEAVLPPFLPLRHVYSSPWP